MGTIENGKKIMKMGYRNFKTQEIWLFEENFMGVVKKKNMTPRDGKMEKTSKRTLMEVEYRNYGNYGKYWIFSNYKNYRNYGN